MKTVSNDKLHAEMNEKGQRAPRRYFQVTSSVGNVTRNVKCSDVQELLGLIDYEIGVGALSIAIKVERERQENA